MVLMSLLCVVSKSREADARSMPYSAEHGNGN